MTKPRLLDTLLAKITPKMQQRTDDKMALAAKIYDAMESKGWSQKRLAQELSVNESIICRWLSGTHNFTTDTLWDIEEVLGITLINTRKPQREIFTMVLPKELAQKYPSRKKMKGSNTTITLSNAKKRLRIFILFFL